MMIVLLSLLVGASAILHLRAEAYGPRRNIYIFKPLTMVLIILIAFETKHALSPVYRYAILGGLVCSLAGDIFLMLPQDRFIQGLVSFLLAHLFYIAAFMLAGGPRAANLLYAIPFLVYGAVMLRVLLPGLGKMKAPVMIYMLVIILMAWQALNRWAATAEQGSALAFAGAMLFVASDSLLAVNRFRKGFRGAQIYIMSTYFMAQWLIALST
jgi:uncharacterized membrane protein YhhN